ncbi:hypothetical protein CF335_g4889 [Tilletia laevis]|nr:hypothetical protein CF335_g4889 [Tilletia laevis]
MSSDDAAAVAELAVPVSSSSPPAPSSPVSVHSPQPQPQPRPETTALPATTTTATEPKAKGKRKASEQVDDDDDDDDDDEDEEADASHMESADEAEAEGEPNGNTDASKPPLKKKRKVPSPSPGPRPPPPRPTVRIKMIQTQRSDSQADPAVPAPEPPTGDPDDDPDLYIMEIPHIMLEQLRAVDHPWATWVNETQKAAQDAQRAEKAKEEEENRQEEERMRHNAAASAAAAAATAAVAAAAAANPPTDAGGIPTLEGVPPGGPPPPAGAPALPSDDLPPHLAALLARHQEKPAGLIPRKRRKKNDVYDATDPFVDDSEAHIDEPIQQVQPKNSGFYVCIGDVEVFKTAQHKGSGRRRVANAAGPAAGPSGLNTKEKGKAAGPAAIAAGAAAGAPNGAGGAHQPPSGKVSQSALASSAKQAGAAGAMDLLLAARVKNTGLTVSHHVVAGVQRPVPPEESRAQPIAVDDLTDDESKAILATAVVAANAADTSSSKLRTGISREKSPVKTLAAADTSSSSLGLRRTPRRMVSGSENKNGPAVQTPEPSGSKATAAATAARDISISITNTPGGSGPGDTSLSVINNTPSGTTNANVNATTPGGSSATGANGKKNRYPCRPVDPKLAQAFEELRSVVLKEPFEVKTKFPAYLKPPLVRTAKLALELGEYNDNFFNWLPTIFPYNRFTMMKLTKREFFEEHTAYYRDLQEENLAALKKLIDKSLPVQKLEHELAVKRWHEAGGADGGGSNSKAAGGPSKNHGAGGDRSSPLTPIRAAIAGAAAPAEEQDEEEGPEAAAGKAEGGNGEEPVKRWRWTEEMRAHLHTCITAENAMVELQNEKMSLENTNKTASDMARRKALYKRISAFWTDEGWTSSSVISREYTKTKNRYEKQAARAAEEVY